MRDFLYKLVQRLHDEGRPLSRNKHFHAFADGGAQRALRIDRHLRDLEVHLAALREQGVRPRVRALADGAVQLVLGHPRLSVVRTATLAPEEVRILRQSEAGRWALAPLDPGEQAEPAPAKAAVRRP
jgi:hypothetical protein